MAYTLQWSNHTVDLWTSNSSRNNKKLQSDIGTTWEEDYNERIGALSPVLSLTRDTLYPNARAVLVEGPDGFSEEPRTPGCAGHQLDKEFPLELKTPTCVPLVQFPTRVDEKGSWEEQDVCALPVLNWENYVGSFHEAAGLMRKICHRPVGGERTTDELEGEAVSTDTRSGKKSLSKQGFQRQAESDYDSQYSEFRRDGRSGARSRRRVSLYRGEVPLETLRRYKNVPEVRVEGTWNYNYHHGGACDWTQHPSTTASFFLLVGRGRHLRVVKLQREIASQLNLAYAVTNIWDEERPLKDVEFGKAETLDSVIHQIVAHRQESLAVVRRSSSIDFYSISDNTQYLTSLPVGDYKKGFERDAKKFISCDLNPDRPYELVTLDDGYCVRVHDFVEERSTFHGECDSNRTKRRSDGPEFSINEAAGALYGCHPQVLYYYFDSAVYFMDTRERLTVAKVSHSKRCYSLLDIKKDLSAKALSDEIHLFSENNSSRLNESVSCVQRSQSPNYYYVGTSDRVLLMDWRVPKHPVIKMSHGMKSPAAYISSSKKDGFEVVVAGSQRSSEIFSAVLDHGHAACENRPECAKLNPILSSYPRHLSNPREFLEETRANGLLLGWQDEQSLVEGHCEAWCTGLTIGNLWTWRSRTNKGAPGSFIVSTNNYGDIFYQELQRKSAAPGKAINREDVCWKNCLRTWHASMKKQVPIKATPKPSTNPYFPEDCSLLIEPSLACVPDLEKVREKAFDPKEVNLIQFEAASNSTQSLESTCTALRRFKGKQVSSFVDVWANDWKPKSSIGLRNDGTCIVGRPFEGTTVPAAAEEQPTETQVEPEKLLDPETVTAADFVAVEIKEEPEDYERRYDYTESEIEVLSETSEPRETVTIEEQPDLVGDDARRRQISPFSFDNSHRQSSQNQSGWMVDSAIPSMEEEYNMWTSQNLNTQVLNQEDHQMSSWFAINSQGSSYSKNSPSQSSSFPKKRAGF